MIRSPSHSLRAGPRASMCIATRAFTLVELVACIVILGTLGTVAATIIRTATDGYLSAATRAQLHVEISTAMDRICRELQNIPADSSASSLAPDIAAITASSITWSTNTSLSLSGTNLMFSEAGATAAVLLSDVSSFSVQSYDESNTALSASLSGSSCDPIRRIQITLTATRSNVSQTVRSRTFLRCTVVGAD